MSDVLLQALGAESGILCAVGAGGKKTVLYRLFAAHPGRVGLTATAFMTVFPDELAAARLVAPEAELEARVPALPARRIAYAQPSEKPGRMAGLVPERVATIHARGGFDLTLVKADGARMRRIKCPAEHEPSLPPSTSTTLLILSALALGKPLSDKIAHRPERVAAVTGRALGEPITPADLAAIYSHPQGLLQGTAGSRVIPVLNMVDTAELEQAGREVARLTLAASPRFDRFVLPSLRRPGFLVAVL
ncbi:MAG: putative selenium-dependent hydroxylase accessory protein YqeC [Xanthomonadaceae bacterium]|nr:putative selenium-dependent hydroxylase accessory protein YqeC [Xanthomonadaceae bacterium]